MGRALSILKRIKENDDSDTIDRIMDKIKYPTGPKSKIREVTYSGKDGEYKFVIDGKNKTTLFVDGEEEAKIKLDATNSYALASFIHYNLEDE